MKAAVISAASSLGVSAEALDVFLHLVSLTSQPKSQEQFVEMNSLKSGELMESLIEEYVRKF